MIERGKVWGITFSLHEGDAMRPESTDVLIADGRLNVGEKVPDGWRVLSGNPHSSRVMATGFRYEFEEMKDG
jgi:hypothetical protein